MKTLLIKNALLIDGSGEKAYLGSLLVQGNRIRDIIPADASSVTDEILDIRGLALAPGFIDIHSHADAKLFVDPLSEAKLRQGVTTEVTGNCGFSPFPAPKDSNRLNLFLQLITSLDFDFPKTGITWTDFSSYVDATGGDGFGTNLLPLVGHGALRTTVMGGNQRKPTKVEMEKMRLLLRECLTQGAWGMSSGLAYAPGSFTESTEIEILCEEIQKQNSYYTSHIRNENDDVLKSIDEVIEVGRKTGCKVNIAHLKAMGTKNWYQADAILTKLENAKAQGIDVSADQYPYPASSTILGILVPKWANDGGTEKMCEHLASPEKEERLLKEIEENMNTRGGPDRIIITRCKVSYDPPIGGKTITQIATEFGLSPVETVAKLIVDNSNVIMAIYMSIAEEDVETILKNKDIMIGSDGMVNMEYPQYSHPRTFGTFPRVLGHYVRDKKLLSIELAVKKMTSLPARRIGLTDRGLLKEGYIADLTIFDPQTIIDRSTYVKANELPIGIYHVMVNGRWVIKNGDLTGERPGKILRKLTGRSI